MLTQDDVNPHILSMLRDTVYLMQPILFLFFFQTGHVFSNYLPGCRYVKIVHGGQDANWWAGHYGVKITLSTVKLDFSHTAGPFQGDYSLPEQQVCTPTHFLLR